MDSESGSDVASSGVALAELVAALSLATDLGLGLPQEHVLRQTLIAQRVGQAAGFTPEQQSAVFYVSLLAWVGCVADSYEMAKWFGDDIGMRADSYRVDKRGLAMMRFLLSHVGSGEAPIRRLTVMGKFVVEGMKDAANSMVTHCQSTSMLASRLGLVKDVEGALSQAFERWDGKGVPNGLAGDAIDPVMRVVQVADDTEAFVQLGGPKAAVEMLRARRGTEFDPELVDLVCTRSDELLGDLVDRDVWDDVVATDPSLGTTLSEKALTSVLEAFGDYADVKSPCWLGHSRRVADLARHAAERTSLSTHEQTMIERAALVHDLGAIGISSGVWDKPGALSRSEQERVRTHPYLTARVLARPSPLGHIGHLAAMHHERLDGSGYPSGLGADAIPFGARLIATADVYDALLHDRPHRPARTEAEAAAALKAEVAAGRLDGDAVNAVLVVAGHRVGVKRAYPAGLTQREVVVLGLVARGRSNKDIARELSVSTHTVGSHVEHIYTKIGVSTRGAAAMYAMSHGLLSPDGG